MIHPYNQFKPFVLLFGGRAGSLLAKETLARLYQDHCALPARFPNVVSSIAARPRFILIRFHGAFVPNSK